MNDTKTSLIFDIDGTLWDSRRSVAIAWDQVIARETGKARGLNAENVSYLFGKPMDEIARLLFPDLPSERQTALGNLCFDRENEYLAQDPGDLFPGVFKTLKTLSKAYPLYLVSNCQTGYIEVFLQSTGLSPFFRGHLCFGDTGLSKDQTILRLMKEHGIGDAVYIGDTQGDETACLRAGIPFVFAEYGFGEATKPWKRIGKFEDLLTLFPPSAPSAAGDSQKEVFRI